MNHVIVIGAGFGGLSAAAELSRAGLDVTVLEAQVYPGGCAGTFFHKGYRFDAGATLAGGFAHGAPMDKLAQHFNLNWEARPTSAAMQVHLPDGSRITRWTDAQRWKEERLAHFGIGAESFWRWQENTAEVIWDLALRLPPWPPQSISDILGLAQTGVGWLQDDIKIEHASNLFALAKDAFHSVNTHIPQYSEKLRLFLDAQLLISAQTTSITANALYGAVALDLARQGVAHVPGGMGGMAEKFVRVIHRHGGKVRFRQEVTRVIRQRDGTFLVKTKRKDTFPADAVIFNLPPWNIRSLLEGPLPSRLGRLGQRPRQGWGAFMVYVGLDKSVVPDNLPLHHQVITGEPLGEGNSLFMSISPLWDTDRVPAGKRALTISTHTNLQSWWQLYEHDRATYENRKAEYTEKLLRAADRALPGIREATDLVMPGTPITFQRFTQRAWGWVGGFPQTSLFKAWGPRLSQGLWMVGDSIFPGQSAPAVSLGGVRVAHALLKEAEIPCSSCWQPTTLHPKHLTI